MDENWLKIGWLERDLELANSKIEKLESEIENIKNKCSECGNENLQ